LTLVYEQPVDVLAGQGFNGPSFHSRDVYVLLSELRDAGVFAGLDSEARIS
jgi:hypothetical protein